jgi:hypothetical protein
MLLIMCALYLSRTDKYRTVHYFGSMMRGAGSLLSIRQSTGTTRDRTYPATGCEQIGDREEGQVSGYSLNRGLSLSDLLINEMVDSSGPPWHSVGVSGFIWQWFHFKDLQWSLPKAASDGFAQIVSWRGFELQDPRRCPKLPS